MDGSFFFFAQLFFFLPPCENRAKPKKKKFSLACVRMRARRRELITRKSYFYFIEIRSISFIKRKVSEEMPFSSEVFRIYSDNFGIYGDNFGRNSDNFRSYHYKWGRNFEQKMAEKRHFLVIFSYAFFTVFQVKNQKGN